MLHISKEQINFEHQNYLKTRISNNHHHHHNHNHLSSFLLTSLRSEIEVIEWAIKFSLQYLTRDLPHQVIESHELRESLNVHIFHYVHCLPLFLLIKLQLFRKWFTIPHRRSHFLQPHLLLHTKSRIWLHWHQTKKQTFVKPWSSSHISIDFGSHIWFRITIFNYYVKKG